MTRHWKSHTSKTECQKLRMPSNGLPRISPEYTWWLDIILGSDNIRIQAIVVWGGIALVWACWRQIYDFHTRTAAMTAPWPIGLAPQPHTYQHVFGESRGEKPWKRAWTPLQNAPAGQLYLAETPQLLSIGLFELFTQPSRCWSRLLFHTTHITEVVIL